MRNQLPVASCRLSVSGFRSWKAVVLFSLLLCLCGGLIVAGAARAQAPASAPAPKIITIASPSPLYTVKVMLTVGSADDPPGKEGLARLVAHALIEGEFGSPQAPITKEKLAEITRPWGSAALPGVRVDKQVTVFTMRVPKEVFPQFVSQILKPMFKQPLFDAKEIDRLRTEELADIESHLRFEEQEALGLEALDSMIFQGTPLSPPRIGTVAGLKSIQREDLVKFYQALYAAPNASIATSADAASVELLKTALPPGGNAPKPLCDCKPTPPEGRDVLIITQPNAIATGIHLGFPIDVKRGDPDYWPLFVANTYLGAHRDDFGQLYHEIRADRGYNYGDYSYVEYLAERPYALFPPPGAPRSQQYFSIWIRPVGHRYAHFVLKAATAELARFIQLPLSARQVEEAKVKARTLYINYAENTERQLGYGLDDVFYGMEDHGYLAEMVKNIDAVTADQVTLAVRKYLKATNLHYVITTNEKMAEKLADDIANNTDCTPKTPAEYHFADPPTIEQKAMMDLDRLWISYPLNIKRGRIRIIKADEMFATANFPQVGGK
jgi:zinc protease